MGGVAAACAKLGYEVTGSEEVLYEPMKSYLADSGVKVYSSFGREVLEQVKPDLVVVGNAVSRGNEELEIALENHLNLVSLPELVSKTLIQGHTSIVVAGTHGKTTTTAMIANMLEVGGVHPGFMIGGVPGNFDVSCRASGGWVFVTEGDEYDSAFFDKRSKFLHYRPDIAVVNNIEFDHADIFDDLEAIKKSFRLFIRLVPRNGVVLANGDDPVVREVLEVACSPVQTFGFGDDCFWRVSNLQESEEGCTFTVYREGVSMGAFTSPVTGAFNAMNMVVAIACGNRLGMVKQQILNGVASYRAPKRRMEEKGTWHGALLIDDFGHHPTAIKQTIDAIMAKYPGRRLIACFEPRSNTTTRTFYQQEILECFAKASAVAFGALDRPWRYEENERLDVAAIQQQLGKPSISISLEEGKDPNWGSLIYNWLETVVQDGDLVVTFSNGDFGGLRALLTATC